MSLKERVTEDMKAAMRAKDAPRLSAVRMLLAAIKQREVDDRIDLSDADVLAIVEKLIKQRRESIGQFQAAQRQDLVDKETFELEMLRQYLPQPVSVEILGTEIDKAIAETGAATARDMGKVMALLKTRLSGRADMTSVSALVRSRLGN